MNNSTFEIQKFKDLVNIQTVIFLFIAPILFLATGTIEKSISQYAQVVPGLFTFLLTLVGALFFYIGYVDRSKWFEMVIGTSMFGLVLFDNVDFYYTHYTFATIFFLACIYNMIAFSSGKYRLLVITLGFTIFFAMMGKFIFDWYSIFWAEVLAIFPIATHKILETLGKID